MCDENLVLTDEEIGLLISAINDKIRPIEDDRWSKDLVEKLQELSRKFRRLRRAKREALEKERWAGLNKS
jgi:hypothetical protein